MDFPVSLNNRGGFSFDFGGRTFTARTRLSEPNGRWLDSNGGGSVSGNRVTWNTPQFRITRTVESTSTHIEVTDEITNRTNSLAGLMLQNSVRTDFGPDAEYLSGVLLQADRQRYNPANPSVFAVYGGQGMGLVASDDILRAQGLIAYTNADGMKLIDNSLGVEGGQTVTLSWSIYPTSSGDYWDFVNAVRRDWGVNFTLDGPFSYEPGDFATTAARGTKGANYYSDWVKQRGLKYVLSGFAHFDDGTVAHGSAITKASKSFEGIQSWMRQAKSGANGVKPFIYFHDQISTEPGADQKYADAKTYNAQGEEIVYKGPQHLPLFLPTQSNSYGQELKNVLGQIIASPDISGVYWDEMSISYPQLTLAGYVYGDTWDGISVQINPTTHLIDRKKTNVALATQPFQVEMVGKIRDAGKLVLGNTQAYTKTMMDLHIPRFVEGKAASTVVETHLGVPLVLANMKAERTPADAIQNAVSIFNLGAIYFGWVERWTPLKPDFNQHLFPITPVDIRPGVITGKERIIVTKSGDYGFADGSKATIYVFDDQAVGDVANITPTMGHGWKNSYHVDVPAGGLAILEKK